MLSCYDKEYESGAANNNTAKIQPLKQICLDKNLSDDELVADSICKTDIRYLTSDGTYQLELMHPPASTKTFFAQILLLILILALCVCGCASVYHKYTLEHYGEGGCPFFASVSFCPDFLFPRERKESVQDQYSVIQNG